MRTALAWGVHLYTASSAVLGVWAVWECFRGELRMAMLLMLATLFIDSTDGIMARALDVARRIPRIDGRRLDDICDYFTYVLLPACFMLAADLLPHPAWVAAPVIASAYGFSRTDAKTEDHYFIGWPSYWNVLVIYLYTLETSAEVNLALVLACAAGVFVPLRYLYPSRAPVLKKTTLIVLALWLPWLAWLIAQPEPDRRGLILSLAAPLYYFAASLFLNLPRRRTGLGLP